MSRQRPAPYWVAALPVAPDAPSRTVVLEQLRLAILGGRVPPGAAIPLDDVAAKFALSRIPVREALTTLVAEGLVEHQPRGAFVVARLNRPELAELYVVRASLETAALAAAVPRATDLDVHTATRALQELEVAAATQGPDGLHRGARAFHLALLAPCRMHRLLGMFEAAWNATELGQPMAHATGPATAALAADHVEMLAAFRARDTERLLALAGAHHDRLQAVVADYPESS